MPDRVEDLRVGQRPVARRLPAVDEDDARGGVGPGGHVPGVESTPAAGRDLERLERRARRRPAPMPAGAAAGSPPGPGTRARTGRPPRTAVPRARRGCPRGGPGGSESRALGDIGPPGMSSDAGGATLGSCPQRTPTSCSASSAAPSPDEIKAAWRSLARRHHPDLTGDDPESVRRATRRMAEINAAYAALTRAGETIEGQRRRDAAGIGPDHRGDGRTDGRSTRAAPGSAGPGGARARTRAPGPRRARRRGGPPPPPRTPPVTGRARPVGQRPAAQPDDDPARDAHPAHRAAAAALGPVAAGAPRVAAVGPDGDPPRPAYVPPAAPPLDDALVPRGGLRQVPRPHAGRDRRRSSRRTSTGSPAP